MPLGPDDDLPGADGAGLLDPGRFLGRLPLGNLLLAPQQLGLSGPSLDTLRYMPYLQLAGYGAIGLGLWITIAGLRKSGK